METKPLRVKNLPLILKKGNIAVLKSNVQKTSDGPFTPNVKIASLYREEVLHETTDVYFLKGEYHKMILVNRLNVLTKVSRTIAKYFRSDGSLLEKTSDGITQIIGQDQYKTVFTALCSIIDQELKIRSILALLTVKTATDIKIECDGSHIKPKVFTDISCQTDEMRIEQLKSKPRRRIRKQVGPYIIPDFKVPEPKKIKKVVVNILRNETDSNDSDSSSLYITEKDFNVTNEDEINLKNKFNINRDCLKKELTNITVKDNFSTVKSATESKRNSIDSLPELGHLHDDCSNESTGRLSVLSNTPTLPEQLTLSFLNKVDQNTKEVYIQPNYKIRLTNGMDIIVPYKPEDVFHIATKGNLQYLDDYSKKVLLDHQYNLDRTHCLTVLDEDGNLPIHLAVINNDLGLLIRQCVVLKIRGYSLDIAAKGLTALKLALFQEAPGNAALAATLLGHGADPLLGDGEHRACAHLAAERDADLLRVTLATCRDNARRILSENEELWKPGMENEPDDILGRHLMKHMCAMFDKQGYSPLMLASMLGLYENVRLLLEHSPESINDRMPTSGNTALYLAVAAACNSSTERGNKSKVVDHFRKTIEILLENGANPTIDNHAGTNVNILLSEFNCAELSMLVANKMTQANFIKREIPEPAQSFDKVMLVMDNQGNVEYKSLSNEKKNKTVELEKKNTIDKPVIVENILLKSPGNTARKTSAGKGKEIVDKSTKTNADVQNIVITGKRYKKPSPIIIGNKRLINMPAKSLKRKIVEPVKKAKPAKIEK